MKEITTSKRQIDGIVGDRNAGSIDMYRRHIEDLSRNILEGLANYYGGDRQLPEGVLPSRDVGSFAFDNGVAYTTENFRGARSSIGVYIIQDRDVTHTLAREGGLMIDFGIPIALRTRTIPDIWAGMLLVETLGSRAGVRYGHGLELLEEFEQKMREQ